MKRERKTHKTKGEDLRREMEMEINDGSGNGKGTLLRSIRT